MRGALLPGFRGKILDFINDDTGEIDLEGSRMCGKTTAALYKLIAASEQEHGLWSFMCRYSASDNDTKLKPEFERICAQELQASDQPTWNSHEKSYDFANGSKVFSFGLKAQDAQSRYAKVRGLSVARILVSQAEEIPEDISEELRAGMRQKNFPHQLIFEANPPDENFWMTDQFPIDNSAEGRRHYSLSLYDNKHNLPPESIKKLERSYPPTHAKYRTLILGLRGVNVTGKPVYGDIFLRHIHTRAMDYDPSLPIIEAFEHGKTHPLWLAGQRSYYGGVTIHAGICGQRMFFGEFLRLVKERRAEWFPQATFQTCCDPPGEGDKQSFNTAQLLRDADLNPRYTISAKAHDIRLTLIERIATLMQTRNASGAESFAVNNDRSRWIRATRKGPMPWEFITDGAEAGYAWDEHMISVGNREIRKPKADDWFELGMMALENLELNFGHAGKKRTRPQWAETHTGPMGWAS